MRHHARGEHQSSLLRLGIDRSKQAASGEPGTPCLGIDRDLAHLGKINDQPAVRGTETCQAMATAADGGQDFVF